MTCIEDKLPTSFNTRLDAIYMKVNRRKSVLLSIGVMCMAKKVKKLVEAVEHDKNLVTFRVIEGDLMEEYRSFVVTIQVSPKSEGSGSIVHWTLEYDKLHDGIAHLEIVL
ncbi:hypothetical protein Gogos_012125 [Gossypium gossypioides]|uniref:Bet v I/Major latex protein domain-containing protein n=1 Tax=Gossypium gossypioides TaxID=34282 RepID=A0A7J9BRI9_GOSGO|nr:hypothetical protein [Gossypium gossypioides]